MNVSCRFASEHPARRSSGKILFNGTDLSPQCKYSGSRQHPGSSTPALLSWRGASEVSALSIRHSATYCAGTTSAVQPSAPCCRSGAGLPLLPHLGGGFKLCWNSSHQDMHELPCASVGGQPRSRAGARKLSRRPFAAVDTRERPAGFCLFRSQHSRSKGSWVHNVPRTGRANAHDVAGKHIVHGVVPSMP